VQPLLDSWSRRAVAVRAPRCPRTNPSDGRRSRGPYRLRLPSRCTCSRRSPIRTRAVSPSSGSAPARSRGHPRRQREPGVPERLGTWRSCRGNRSSRFPSCTRRRRVVAKLKETRTGDTLADRRTRSSSGHQVPGPAISFAVEPKSKGDEEKISTSLARLTEETRSCAWAATR